MLFKKYILLYLLTISLGCNGQENSTIKVNSEIEKEIRNLDKEDSKKMYLEQISKDDQTLRNSIEGTDLMLKYGINSKEYMEYAKKTIEQDNINLIKIEKYLEIHGHPDKKLGSEAVNTPWIVIHHAQGYEARQRNFEIIYEAYLKGNIDNSAITFYLGRMYQIKNGVRLNMKSPYTIDDEINQLIRELKLENSKKIKGF